MVFKWLNKQGVESDKGFIVQCTGRFTIEYIEGSRKIIIDIIDHGWAGGKYIDMVRADNFEKWENGWPIDKEKQKEIMKNFIEAMAFQNIGIDIEAIPDKSLDKIDMALEVKLKTSFNNLK